MSTKEREKRGSNQFQQSWLTKYDWVKYKNATSVTCVLCNRELSITNMGESSLKRHEQPNPPEKDPSKHQKLAAEKAKAKQNLSILHFRSLNPRSSCSSSTVVTSGESSSAGLSESSAARDNNVTPTATLQQPTLDQYVVPVSIAQAEILWVMKVVTSHFSLRSCLGMSKLFQKMFHDSQIAKEFAMSKTKCGYYINFGLAPYYGKMLLEEIKKSPYYTILFDESLNKVIQSEQMDAFVRYWCVDRNCVKTRYFDSQFLNRPNAVNLTQAIYDSLKDLRKENMIHLSMDGPSTNWLVFNMIGEKRVEDGLSSPLENIGSCGLHIVSGALQTGVQQSGWPLKKVMQSMYKLFNDSPARRDIYMKLNGSSLFAERFCPTRWVENEQVADRAIAVWDFVATVIKHYTSQTQSKRPQKNTSYDTLVENDNDKLMKVKMCVFRDIAHRMNGFLTLFQTDAPMIPFLADTLETIMPEIMGFFITDAALNKASTSFALNKLDVTVEGGLCLPIADIKLPTAAKSMLRKLKLKNEEKQSFLKNYRQFLIGIIRKIQERSPLKYALVRYASALNPGKMVHKEALSKRLFGGLLDVLFEHKRLTSVDADNIKSQYEDFLKSVVHANGDVFRNFDNISTRLDDFYVTYMSGNKRYEKLWDVFVFVFVLSHGQASIERGFNVNKEVLVENLAKESLISQRLVYDELRDAGVELHTMPIPRELIICCKTARQKYMESLQEKKEKSQETEVSNKRKLKMEEITSVKRKKMDVEKVISTLKADIDEACIEASGKDDYESMKVHLEKANGFRVVLKKKVETVKELDWSISKLEDELKNC